MLFLEPGDQIQVGVDNTFGLIQHHGICVGDIRKVYETEDIEVIHFHKRERFGEVRVEKTPISDFGDITKITKVEKPPSRISKAKIVQNAYKVYSDYYLERRDFISKIFKGYNFLTNNCEHLATLCRLEEMKSNQVEDVMAALQKYGPLIHQALKSR